MNWNEMIEKRRAKELADETALPIQISGAAYMYEFERAMSQLSPLERTALSLRYVAPLPIARVADGMGMSWDGADELIDRAVQRVQNIFSKSNRGKAA